MLSQSVKVDRVFHALGDPTRRAIVETLSHGPTSASSLAKQRRLAALGDLLAETED